MRLFCLPYAGGNASIFRRWSDSLPPFIEVVPIEIPGRGAGMGEKPFKSIGSASLEILLFQIPVVTLFGHWTRPESVMGRRLLSPKDAIAWDCAS